MTLGAAHAPVIAASGPTERRRIRVLHLSDKLTIGGAHMHGVARLISWWIPQFDGAEFEVIGGSLRRRDRAGAYMESLGIRMVYLGRRKFDPRTLMDLLRLIDRERLDLLHLHGYASSDFGRLAAHLRGIPAIVHEHMELGPVPVYQHLADRLLARRTTHAIAVSESVRDFMVRSRHVPQRRIEVLYNGVRLDEFPRPSGFGALRGDRPWRAELGIPSDHAVVGILGRLHPVKGHTDFLRAAREVAAAWPRVRFVVVGDGDLRPDLEAQVADLGLRERLHFLGHRLDVAEVLQGVDIKVIASTSEGIPLTLFEAMAAGCAIVATRVGGLPEIVQDGVNGLLVAAGRPGDIAATLLKLLREPELRARLASEARRTAERYDVVSTVRRQEALYRRLVRAGAA